jgi:putative ABC transport system permease protein
MADLDPDGTRDWSEYIRARLRAIGETADDGVILEWAHHAAAALAAARAEGATGPEAEREVRRLIDEWGTRLAGRGDRPRRAPAIDPPATTASGWTGLGHDLRYGVRLLGRQPGFAVLATLLIAIGVGTTTTLSSLTYAVVLKPLPWPGADRVVRLAEHREGQTHPIANAFTNLTYRAWLDHPQTIDALAAWGVDSATVGTGGEAHRAQVVSSTAGLFAVAAVPPAAGRYFTTAEEMVGADRVVVLSERLARELYLSPEAAVGQNVLVDGTSRRVLGVAGRSLAFPNGAVDAWIPLDVPPVVSANGQGRSLSLLSGAARLKPGVTAPQAAAEGTARAQLAPDPGLVADAVFGTRNKPTLGAQPYLDSITADVRPALYVIMVGVLLLFVGAIANVAGMQLARTTTRRREVAIRSALGAAPGRLARQLLTENLAIGLLGGLAGGVLSVGLHQVVPRLLPASVPRLDGFRADWRVLACALMAAVGASVIFGALPALIARRQNLVEALVEDSLAPAGIGRRTTIGRLRSAILVGQIAIATLLLTGASLFGRSFMALVHVDRGYEPHHLATVTFPMPDQQFTGLRRAQILDALVDRLTHTPGVTAAAAASVMPLLPFDQMMGFRLPPGPGRPQPTVARAEGRLVSPGYFAAMGMHILRGRGFSTSDSAASAMVVLVNQTFATRYLPGEPLGAVVPMTYVPNSHAGQTVIGVVDDVHQHAATDPPQPEIFFDYRQLTVGMLFTTPVVLARTTGDPGPLLPTIARFAQEVEPGLVADSAFTMDERLMASLAQPRLDALLFATFAAFALLVAASGLFGVLSYAVAQRARELGVRTALGARPADIARLVFAQGLGLTLAGIGAGLAAAVGLVTLVGTLLYGVTAHDRLTFALVPAVILAVAALASYGPARRAARVDPLIALRNT